MAEIKVNKSVWDNFGEDAQHKAVKFLKRKGILNPDDTVVGAEDAGAPMELLDTVENCIDGCVPASNAAFVACKQNGGSDDECFEARAEAFYECMADCQG